MQAGRILSAICALGVVCGCQTPEDDGNRETARAQDPVVLQVFFVRGDHVRMRLFTLEESVYVIQGEVQSVQGSYDQLFLRLQGTFSAGRKADACPVEPLVHGLSVNVYAQDAVYSVFGDLRLCEEELQLHGWIVAEEERK